MTYIRFVFAFAFINCHILNAKTVFVSSTNGSDNNNGLSKESPFFTISRASIANADTILLFTDDTFYETVNVKGTYLSRYGSGKNPTICGLRKFDNGCWKEVAENIWKSSLSTCCNNGFIVKGTSRLNNIGCFYEPDRDVLHGRRVQYYDELEKNWDYWQTENYSSDMDISEFDVVYLYLEKDPNEYVLDCTVGAVGLVADNATIDGVNVIGFGFGIVAGDKTIIRNCKIDIIGGMILIGYSNFAPYGNGIEFNLSNTSKTDCVVENCMVSRTYDSGMTIQASKATNAIPQNIVFKNNLLINCCQGWEDYLLNPDNNVRFLDCVFENNIVLDSGYSGFGYPSNRVNYCGILGYNSKGNKGMIIRNNLFIGGNYYCSSKFNTEYKSNFWENNRCFLEPGSYVLSNPSGTEDVIVVSKSNRENVKSINKYRLLTGDETTQFTIKKKKWIKKYIRKELKMFLKRNEKYFLVYES